MLSPLPSPTLQIMMMMMLMIMRVALCRLQLRLCLCLTWSARLLHAMRCYATRLASAGFGLRAVGGCTTMPNSLIYRIGRQAGGMGNELCHSLNVAHM